MCVEAGSTTLVFLTMASTISVVEMATPQQHDPFFSSSSFPLKRARNEISDHLPFNAPLPFNDHSHALHVLLDFVPPLGIVLFPYSRIYIPKFHSAHRDAGPERNCKRGEGGMIAAVGGVGRGGEIPAMSP